LISPPTSSVGGASFSYDARGNLTSDGTTTYSYDAYNRLTAASGTATLGYDPASRLYQTAGAATTRFLYDGQEAIAEYNSSNALQRRYVFGPGIDEPIVWYEGSGTTDRRWLIANEQNSIIAITDGSGAALSINSYDEYGQPASTNAGRFQFTGQMWLPEASLYNFKARDYSASLGRFMQTDPILQYGGLNIYAYVGNDPCNNTDATGLDDEPPIIVTGHRPHRDDFTMDAFLYNFYKFSDLQVQPQSEGERGGAGSWNKKCPSDAEGFVSSMQVVAEMLSDDSAGTGVNTEAGGALGGGESNSYFSSTNGATNLPYMRSEFERQFGFYPSYDWHTHPDAGVNGSGYGFSDGDVMTTAAALDLHPEFQGSFVIMSDQVLYMSAQQARNLVRTGKVQETNPGIRCR
jgi:RHS repeat-associated protein